MKKCRICGNKVREIIHFGKIPLVGVFLKIKKKQKKYNISLNYCKKCKHVQIIEVLNPNLLFKNYLWETGISESNITLINQLLTNLKKYGINNKSKVLEIASNDGSFLKILKRKYNSVVLGIDPAKNLTKKANKKKILTINNYFNLHLSKYIKKKYEKFNFIFARNVIAHLHNPNQTFKGVETLLEENGIFIIEVPHLLNILNKNQYDNIFHEHVGFHSLKSIIDLAIKNELKVFDVEMINSQGGSIRCYLIKKKSKRKTLKSVNKILDIEKKSNLFSKKNLKAFKIKIKKHSLDMNNLITKLKKKGKKISIYGASGKGQALMHFCKMDNRLIDYVFDKSSLKQGKFTPGTNIKILNPKFISNQNIDYLIILSWNIQEEIIKQEKKFLKKGGKFIIPFPNPRIIN
jgi:2-polyprenyl-3-methyl-5-hydroxy-6-metoxy-1,4-benzoquinol methylase